MSGKFIRSYEVGSRAITPNMRLAPSDVFDLLQETSTVHSDVLGYNMDYFIREQKGWAILNWHAEFDRLPVWRERVTVETWPTEGKGLVANRNFRVLGGDGSPIMKAFSQWVYFDNVRRRPIKISGDMLRAYTTDLEDVFPSEKFKTAPPDESLQISGSRLTVRRSHTDSNFHVNNVVYIKWAEDDLPDNVFNSGKLRTISVNYRKEAKVGVEIETSVYEAGKNHFACFIRDTEGNTFVEILMEYAE